MAQNRYRLNGSSLAELGARAIREYGPSARIVDSEKIPAKGLAGFFGRHHYQAVVEVIEGGQIGAGRSDQGRPEAAGSQEVEDTVVITHGVTGQQPPQDLVAQDSSAQGAAFQDAAPGLPMSGGDATEAEVPEFAEMIDQLRRALRDPGPEAIAAARNRAPAPLRAAGALVTVTGLASDAEAAAPRLGLEGAVVWDLESRAGSTLRDMRRDLLQARADAVTQQVPVLAIAPLGFPRPGARSGADHPVIRDADQLWVAVDVSRKVEDTRRWLSVVAENRGVDGALLVGAERTLTPETGRQLGLPVYNRVSHLE